MLDPELSALPDREAARSSRAALEAFLQRIGLTPSLAEVHPSAADLEVLVSEAMSFPDTLVNPVVPTEEQVRAMFVEISAGRK